MYCVALGLVAGAAGFRNRRAIGAALLVGLRADVVRAVAVVAGRRRALRGALQRLAVDAVVEFAADIAARHLARRRHGVAAMALRARRLDVGVIGARRRILRAQDVVRAVAVRAIGGDGVAALARGAVHRSRIVLDCLVVAGCAVDGLQLVGMRQLVHRDIRMAIGAFELHLAMHRGGELRTVDGDGLAGRALGILVRMTHETGVGDAGSGAGAGVVAPCATVVAARPANRIARIAWMIRAALMTVWGPRVNVAPGTSIFALTRRRTATWGCRMTSAIVGGVDLDQRPPRALLWNARNFHRGEESRRGEAARRRWDCARQPGGRVSSSSR